MRMLNLNTYKKLTLVFLKNNKLSLLFGILFSSLSIILQMVSNYILDTQIISKIGIQNKFSIDTIFIGFVYFMLVFLIEIVIFLVSQIIVMRVAEKGGLDALLDFLNSFLYKTQSEIKSKNKGELIEKVNLSVDSYKSFIDQLSGVVVKNVINILFLSIFFGSLGFKYIFVIIWAFIFNLVKKQYFQPIIDNLVKLQDEQSYTLSAKFQEIVRNLDTLKHFNSIALFVESYKNAQSLYLNKFLKAELIQTIYKAITYINNALILFLVLWFLLKDYENNSISFGIFLFGYTSSIIIVFASNNIFNVINNFEKSKNRLNVFYELLTPVETKLENLIYPQDEITSINVKNLNLEVDNKKVFDNFNCSFELNQSYAIVGESGSGKSTLAKLISGLEKPENNTIIINNNEFIEKYNPNYLFEQITLIPQQTEIFNLSILDNITLLKKYAESEILNVIKVAQLENLINQLPLGINTIIGDGGKILSGGEQQRIAIARSILLNNKVLIFDESTSSLDPLTESKVLKEILKLKENKIIIFITHKHNLLDNFDKVLKL